MAVKRAIQRHVQDLLAKAFLAGEVADGGKVILDADGDRLYVRE